MTLLLNDYFGVIRASHRYLEDDGPEQGVEEGVGRDLDVSLYQAMKHQCQNTYQTPDPNISLRFMMRDGTNA